jgi:hypothetical protein
MSPRAPDAPIGSAAHFRVRIADVEIALSSVTGLSTAGQDGLAPPRVTLRRALTGDRRLFDWWQHRAEAADVVVEVLSPDVATPVAAWVLHDARPSRWSGPTLDALAGGVAFEELDLTFARVDWRHPEP